MPITVSLAEPAARWIDERVAAGDCPDAAAYVAEMVERDREDAAKHVALKAAIDEGLASGVSGLNFEDVKDRALQAALDDGDLSAGSPHTVEEIFANARARHSRVREGWAEAARRIADEHAN